MIKPDCAADNANLPVFRRLCRFGQRPDGLGIAQIAFRMLFFPDVLVVQ